MAKRTVLDIVQATLIHISSDQVNSWDDTDESRDVGYILRDAYFDMIDGQEWPHLRNVIQLTNVNDTSNPHLLSLAEAVQKIDNQTLKYDVRVLPTDDPLFKGMIWYEPEEFLKLSLSKASSLSDTNIIETTSPVPLYIYNDRAPTYFTSFDDETLVFDSYDSDVDTTLQGSKTRVIAYSEASFTLSDGYTPDLPSKAFPQLMAEVKSRASASIAQEIDQKQEFIAQRLAKRSENDKRRTTDGIRTPDYGRQARRSRTTRIWTERT